VAGFVTTPNPGPLAEEAARLLEAVAGWARGATAGLSTPEPATGPECQVCPVCQLLAVVRRASPETFGHLVDASASLAAALRTLLDSHDHGHDPHDHSARPSRVSRIDLDEPDERVAT
jgi:hypothetical protein